MIGAIGQAPPRDAGGANRRTSRGHLGRDAGGPAGTAGRGSRDRIAAIRTSARRSPPTRFDTGPRSIRRNPPMKLTVIGSGYVGLVTGACLADVGNHVLCVDIDKDKVARLNAGEVPIHEPGLDEV